MKKSPKFF